MIPDFANIALIVVDIQEKLLPAIPDADARRTLGNAELLAELVSDAGGMVVYTEQYPNGLGSTVESLRAQLQGATRIEKVSFSCLGDESFVDQVLDNLPSDVIVVGMESHICVLQTVFDLVGHAEDQKIDRMVYVPVDAIAAGTTLHHENALRQLGEVAVLTTAETLVFQALEDSRHPRFKHFSKRVRELRAAAG